jgi:radical SAM protein with 4Fe4S-binding SPASM domain
VQNINYLWLSVNDHRPAFYTQTMQLPYERTLQRLHLIHAYKQAGRLPFRVVLSRVGDGSMADQDFVHWVRDEFPAFESFVSRRGSWIGQVDIATPPVPHVGCTRWFDMSITSTGIVAHCCMDGQAQYPVGDVRTQHLLDIYNSPAYRHLRETQLSRLGIEPCSSCSFL